MEITREVGKGLEDYTNEYRLSLQKLQQSFEFLLRGDLRSRLFERHKEEKEFKLENVSDTEKLEVIEGILIEMSDQERLLIIDKAFFEYLHQRHHVPETQLRAIDLQGMPLKNLSEVDREIVIRRFRCRHQRTSLIAYIQGSASSLHLECVGDCGGHSCTHETLEEYHIRNWHREQRSPFEEYILKYPNTQEQTPLCYG